MCSSNPSSIFASKVNPLLQEVRDQEEGYQPPQGAAIRRESGQREPPVDTLQHMELVWYSIASHFEGKG